MKKGSVVFSPEQRLWRAVILQAFLDLASNATSRDIVEGKHWAKLWLFSSSRDLFMVCDFADIHPHAIRKSADKIQAERIEYRTLSGNGSRYMERKMYRENQKLKKLLAKNLGFTTGFSHP